MESSNSEHTRTSGIRRRSTQFSLRSYAHAAISSSQAARNPSHQYHLSIDHFVIGRCDGACECLIEPMRAVSV